MITSRPLAITERLDRPESRAPAPADSVRRGADVVSCANRPLDEVHHRDGVLVPERDERGAIVRRYDHSARRAQPSDRAYPAAEHHVNHVKLVALRIRNRRQPPVGRDGDTVGNSHVGDGCRDRAGRDVDDRDRARLIAPYPELAAVGRQREPLELRR